MSASQRTGCLPGLQIKTAAIHGRCVQSSGLMLQAPSYMNIQEMGAEDVSACRLLRLVQKRVRGAARV